jgi:hypothetical protein
LYRTVAILLGVLVSVASARAGWIEVGDAGRLPVTAQTPLGTGTLDFIRGSLGNDIDVDVYRIQLTGGGTFSATTEGLSAVDTKLFLFDATGRGVYMNDDADVFTLQSLLPAGDPLTPLAAGEYYLAITGFDLDPVSVAGLIFPDPLFPEGVYGPTGPGGGSPVLDFLGSGDFGDYEIRLTGANFVSAPQAVPEPSSLALAAVGGLVAAAARVRRRRASPC